MRLMALRTCLKVGSEGVEEVGHWILDLCFFAASSFSSYEMIITIINYCVQVF